MHYALQARWSSFRIRPTLYILEWETPSLQGYGKRMKRRGAKQSMTRMQFEGQVPERWVVGCYNYIEGDRVILGYFVAWQSYCFKKEHVINQTKPNKQTKYVGLMWSFFFTLTSLEKSLPITF